MTGPAAQWAEQLAAWAIPEAILAAAPEPPWGFDVGLFSRVTDEAMATTSPSRDRALEELPEGGTVLDVGCGAGAASLPLVPPAGCVVGVDESVEMLAAFATRAESLGVEHTELAGRWPDVAAEAPIADVVVCHNVAYNVAALAPFGLALDEHAQRRVVVELTERHPLTWMRPYWAALHGADRPEGPTAADAVAVLADAGLAVRVEPWTKPAAWEHRGEDLVAFVRRRLCLPATRDPEIRAAIEHDPPPSERSVVTLWWNAA